MPSRLQFDIKQSKPFTSLRLEVLPQLARTAAVLTHAWEQHLRRFGITLTQFNVLRILRGAGEDGMCRHEIASRLITPVPDVSRLLDRMVLAGLVTRTRGSFDRRMVKACITEAGLAVLSELDQTAPSMAEQQLAHLSDDQIRTLIDLLESARYPQAAAL